MNINTEEDFMQCLKNACEHGKSHVVEMLFGPKYDNFNKTEQLEEVLKLACENGCEKIVNALLPRKRYTNLCVCIRIALKNNHREIYLAVKRRYNKLYAKSRAKVAT
jgi:S-adenosylmethionine/arginine decarboxylase-like enzyme